MKAQEYYEKGLAYQNDGFYSKALICYDAATKLGLNIDNIVSYNIGISYLNTGSYDEAIEWLIKSVKLNPDDAEAYCGLGSAYCSKMDYSQAIECFEMAIRLKPDNAIKAMAYTKHIPIWAGFFQRYIKIMTKQLSILKWQSNQTLIMCIIIAIWGILIAVKEIMTMP